MKSAGIADGWFAVLFLLQSIRKGLTVTGFIGKIFQYVPKMELEVMARKTKMSLTLKEEWFTM